MRNSAAKYNQQPISPTVIVMFSLLLLNPPLLNGEQTFTVTSEDMVAIRADQAWEEIQPETVHFTGHFEMRIQDWVLNADQATLQGKLDDPDRVVLLGSPARFSLSHKLGDRTEAITAEAQEIIYARESELILLNGTARLTQGDNVLHSNRIEYNFKTDRFSTRDQTDVQIDVQLDQHQ